MKLLTVRKNDAGQRLDKFLLKAVKAMPPSLMYKSIRTKKIKVNRKRAEIGQLLQEGDTVQLFLSDELFGGSSRDADRLRHITPSFSVVYEDENLLLCDKPAGLPVHSDDKEDTYTLITQIKAYLLRRGEYDPDKEQSFAPALCNRIDRNTAGIVIAAKNAAALRELNALIRDRKITKKYLCAVHGSLKERSGVLTGYLLKDSASNTVTVFRKPVKGSKSIRTGYTVLEEREGLSLIEAELFTGRTHQIRAHFASIGHPLLGDGKYGVNREDRKAGLTAQALYSYYLRFDEGELFSYLVGREFTVPAESIWFVRRFFKGGNTDA